MAGRDRIDSAGRGGNLHDRSLAGDGGSSSDVVAPAARDRRPRARAWNPGGGVRALGGTGIMTDHLKKSVMTAAPDELPSRGSPQDCSMVASRL